MLEGYIKVKGLLEQYKLLRLVERGKTRVYYIDKFIKVVF